MHSSGRAHEKAWVEQIREGDEGAFERLFRAYHADLCRFGTRYVSSRAVVEDLVQDVFFSVWRRRRVLDPQRDVRAYLYTAVRNEALKHLNQRRIRTEWKAEQKLQVPPLRSGPEEQLHHTELETAVLEALEGLPERRREIYTLSRQHGLTYAEIARLLDISVKTVETQMGRALRFLEKRLSAFLSVLM